MYLFLQLFVPGAYSEITSHISDSVWEGQQSVFKSECLRKVGNVFQMSFVFVLFCRCTLGKCCYKRYDIWGLNAKLICISSLAAVYLTKDYRSF